MLPPHLAMFSNGEASPNGQILHSGEVGILYQICQFSIYIQVYHNILYILYRWCRWKPYPGSWPTPGSWFRALLVKGRIWTSPAQSTSVDRKDSGDCVYFWGLWCHEKMVLYELHAFWNSCQCMVICLYTQFVSSTNHVHPCYPAQMLENVTMIIAVVMRCHQHYYYIWYTIITIIPKYPMNQCYCTTCIRQPSPILDQNQVSWVCHHVAIKDFTL